MYFLGRKEEMYIKENILGQKFSEMFLGFFGIIWYLKSIKEHTTVIYKT